MSNIDFRNLHQHVVVFWILAAFGVFGTAFGVWSHIANQPSRLISYRVVEEKVFDVETLGSPVTIEDHTFDKGGVYRAELTIWNSGNQTIEAKDISQPIQWSDAPTNMHLQTYGITPAQIEGDIHTGLTFKTLYPNTGIRYTFISPPVENLTLVGGINGVVKTTGLYNTSAYWIKIKYVWIGLIVLIIVLVVMDTYYAIKKGEAKGRRIDFTINIFLGTALLTFVVSSIYLGGALIFFNLFLNAPF